MKPYYSDSHVTLYQGDAFATLRGLPDESVHCCVTSPPYWGLRDYGQEGQLGLEPTPEEYVANLVRVFREVRRVLRADGTLWLNLGDSYNGSQQTGGTNSISGHGASQPHGGILKMAPGLKPKDLVGIPWRVAFALQADGWWLRSDIIWSKPSPMPESVRDRPTKSHEYVFLLSKSARYFYDAEAILEPVKLASLERAKYAPSSYADVIHNAKGRRAANGTETNPAGRNKRSVWTITTKPYPEAHFATFPPELPELCIKAGTSAKGCCSECGAPWERVVERSPGLPRERDELRNVPPGTESDGRSHHSGDRHAAWKAAHPDLFLGWRPTCDHDTEPVQCVVLDPFAGAGTGAHVAKALNRRSVNVELNAEYCDLICERCAQGVLAL